MKRQTSRLSNIGDERFLRQIQSGDSVSILQYYAQNITKFFIELARTYKDISGNESVNMYVKKAVKYTNRLRMEKAEMLLLNSDMSIVDIAESVGFNSRQMVQRTAYVF